MAHTMRDQLNSVPLRNAKADTKRGEGRVQKLNREAGDVLDQARKAADLEAKQMADTCAISHSLCLRALESKGDIGFHRLWELDDTFWSELMVAIAKRRRVAIVRTTIELPDRSRRSA